jgi:hypothetical protein
MKRSGVGWDQVSHRASVGKFYGFPQRALTMLQPLVVAWIPGISALSTYRDRQRPRLFRAPPTAT